MRGLEGVLGALGAGAGYSGAGVLILVFGAWVLDLFTPGRLAHHVFGHRSPSGNFDSPPSWSAGIVLASGLAGQGLVIFTAIWTNSTSGFGSALGWTVLFGLMGVAITSAAFLVVDLLTPGKLGDVVCVPGPPVPAAIVAGAAQLASALIVCASIA